MPKTKGWKRGFMVYDMLLVVVAIFVAFLIITWDSTFIYSLFDDSYMKTNKNIEILDNGDKVYHFSPKLRPDMDCFYIKPSGGFGTATSLGCYKK